MTQGLSVRAFLMSALLLVAAIAETGWAADLTMNAAINKAGRQRMLTQRIIKSYTQAQLAAQPELARAQLADAVHQFDAQLAELKAWSQDGAVRGALADVERLWTPFRAVAVSAPSRDGLRQLIAGDEVLLGAAQNVVRLLQDQSGTPVGRLVNISGRQRMLSQRLAKIYMLRLAGFEALDASVEIDAAQNEFERALGELTAAAQEDAVLASEMRAVALQWEWFRAVLTFGDGRSYALIVADASESIVNSMDRVTALYEGLPRR